MDDEIFNGAQLLCPVCASVVDATSLEQADFECSQCGQTWHMPLDADTLKRLREYGV